MWRAGVLVYLVLLLFCCAAVDSLRVAAAAVPKRAAVRASDQATATAVAREAAATAERCPLHRPCIFAELPVPVVSVTALTPTSIPAHISQLPLSVLHVLHRRSVAVPVFPEVCEYTGITLTRYMCEIARANPGLNDLETLISSIQTACKTINSLVTRAHITGIVGYADGGGSINVQGEEQKTLDVLTNDVLKRALRFTGKMGVIASEDTRRPSTYSRTRALASTRTRQVTRSWTRRAGIRLSLIRSTALPTWTPAFRRAPSSASST